MPNSRTVAIYLAFAVVFAFLAVNVINGLSGQGWNW